MNAPLEFEVLDTDLETLKQPEPKAEQPLRYWVEYSLNKYFANIGDQEMTGVYDMVIKEVERGILKAVMRKNNGNQSKAAIMLGIARGTLRNRLQEYGLD